MYDKYVKDIVDLYDKEQDEYDELEKKELPHEKEHEEEDKIAKKYDKLILDINKKYNIIFRYDLVDAWGVQISTLVVTNDKKDNVWCVYNNEDQKEELENSYFTVDSNKVLNVISKYEEKLHNVKDIETHEQVEDGYFNNFYFNINGDIYTFNLDNLGVWNDKITEDTKLFLDLISDIREVLIKDVKNLDRCLTIGY